jgi:CRP/FNR family transcriptional regulator, cyclic AMP receptor protein
MHAPDEVPTLDSLLRTSTWTRELTADHRDMVRRTITDRPVGAGTYVCRRGEAIDYWFGIVDGFVKISSDSQDGRSVTFTCVAAGGWFGEGSILKDEPRRYDVIALRDTRIARLPRTTFLWLLDNSMAFNRFLVHQLNERLGQFIAMLEFERTLAPDIRVARCLSVLFNPLLYPRTDPSLGISQEEIASLCGLSRQTVNQALHALDRRGWLRVDFRGITVTDLRGLRTFAASD